jgi:hypothetical protein
MNAARKLRSAILVGSLALVAVGTMAASAEAAQPYSNLYAHHRAVYGNTLQYYPTTTLPPHVFRTTHVLPSYKFRTTPVCYPVTLYDSFGRPYVVHTTSYSTFVR